MRSWKGVALVWVGTALLPTPAAAMKLATKGTRVEIAVAEKYASWFQREVLKLVGKGVDGFTEPVHEGITQKMFGCDADAKDCLNSGRATDYVLTGVRWNDDPPFRLDPSTEIPKSCKAQETIRFTTQPRCWATLFQNAAKRAAAGEDLDDRNHSPLLHRSHFGDLQFIHAMASKKDEAAEVTQARIMGWAEFTWRVALGELKLETNMSSVPIASIADLFTTSGLRIQDLFTLGNVALRPHLSDVAFGSLLHLVQDSFAKGHAARRDATHGQACPGLAASAPGGVQEFHVYGIQDSGRHGEYDKGSALSAHLLSDEPNVVDVGREIVGYREKGADWEAVKPYFECVFRLEESRPASAGAGFEKR